MKNIFKLIVLTSFCQIILVKLSQGQSYTVLNDTIKKVAYITIDIINLDRAIESIDCKFDFYNKLGEKIKSDNIIIQAEELIKGKLTREIDLRNTNASYIRGTIAVYTYFTHGGKLPGLDINYGEVKCTQTKIYL